MVSPNWVVYLLLYSLLISAMSISHWQKQNVLGITTFGVVDTNCDPNKVDFAIPANDDATKSIAIITNYITAAIAEGLAERQAAKDEETEESVDDENEKKAASLEAEAQAEGWRWW